MEVVTLIQAEAVACAGSDFGLTGKITIRFRQQRLKDPLRSRIHIFLENQIDPARLWRPNTKMCPAWSDDFGTDWQTALKRRIAHALNSPISREAVAH